MDQSLVLQIQNRFPEINIKTDYPLAPFTTLKIGGPADIFIQTESVSQLTRLLTFLASQSTPITILGNGSNILISDFGLSGVVIKNTGNSITTSESNPNHVTISSGTSLAYAINWTLDHHLTGLEYYAYIPATIGGAVYSHIHGVENHQFSQILNTVTVFNLKKRKVENLQATALKWAYDYSQLQDEPHLVILSAKFNLIPGNPQKAKQFAKDIIDQKSSVQPLNSAGSVFKNPTPKDCLPLWGETKSAGWIIEHELNLKGYSLGDAQIGPQHANIFTNQDKATASDFYRLIRLVQDQSLKKLGLPLQLEIQLLGQFKD
ncbi:MAG: UDP-N-acetylmuramate dehydrogenase [Patescibacteria group bacterium]|jgi:UDP-N-acetylmuramate dehydrogenase